MEYLALGLVLLARTLTASSPLPWQALSAIEEVALDMALSSFDDQYQGCSRMMEEELGELNRTEFTTNDIYARAWTTAAAEWRRQQGRIPQTLPPEQAIALLAYTQRDPMYQVFNAAVREAGQSRREYLHNFHFKVLHFLLSEALRSLRDAGSRRCHQVYRGIRGIHFTAQKKQSVRFGHFTSTSLQYNIALYFGQDTVFSIKTCYGVPIRDFSFYPDEEEVLIPPFESFEVTNVTHKENRAFIQLHSQAAKSTYNCEFVKGDASVGRSLPATGVQGMGRRGGGLTLPALLGKGGLDRGERNGGDLGLGCASLHALPRGLQWGAVAAKHSTAQHGTVW